MGNAVLKKKSAELSTDVMDDVFEMAGAGADFDPNEIQPPRLKMIQSMSPEKDEVEGLEVGDIYCKLTGEKWSKPIKIIACYVRTNYPVFAEEGGFTRELTELEYNAANKVREGTSELLTDTGEEVIKTDNYACLMNDGDDNWRPVILPMIKASLKTSRQWKSAINVRTMKHPKTGQVAKAPIFYNIWNLTTKGVTKQIKGKNAKYFEWSVQLDGDASPGQLMMAKDFHISCKQGAVTVKSNENDNDASGTKQTKSQSRVKDTEVPF
jgi:hypothetical protein